MPFHWDLRETGTSVMAGTLYLDHPGRGCHEYTKICFRTCRSATFHRGVVSRRLLRAPHPGAGRVRPAIGWTGQICPIVLTDITAFSAPRRNDEDRLALRHA